MRHLPFNHCWVPIGVKTRRVSVMDPYNTDSTSLNLACDCGRVKTKKIASFIMTDEQIAQYLEIVYTSGPKDETK